MNIKSKTKKAIPYIIALKFFNIIISLLGMVKFVRYLGVKEYAIFSLLMGLPSLFFTLVSFGNSQYILRYFPSMKDHKEISQRFWTIFIRSNLFLLSIIAIMILGFNLFSNRFGLEGYYLHFIIFQIIVIAQFSEYFLFTLLNAKFLQKHIFYLTVFQQISRTTLIFIGATTNSKFIFFIISFAIIWIVKIGITSIIILKKYGFPKIKIHKLFNSLEKDIEIKNYKKINYINQFGINFLKTDVDRYFLATFSTNIQVAIYSLGTNIMRKIGMFIPSSMFKQLVGPTFFSKFDESNNSKDLNKMFRFLINLNYTFTIIYLGIFIPLGKDLLTKVFHQNYAAEAYAVIIIYLILLIFYGMDAGNVAHSIKKPHILLVSKIASVFNIITGIPLSYKFGAWGMALATALSSILKRLIILGMTKKYVELTIPWKSMFKWIINTGVLIIFVHLFSIIFNFNLIINCLFGIFAYCVIIKLNPIMDKKERALMYSLIPNKFVKYVKILY